MRKDGTRFWASVVITALRDDSGRLRGFGKVTRDMTAKHEEQERLREHARQLAELEHTKAQFLDLAAHELRAPLTLIRGYNSMLQDGALDPARIPEITQLLESRLSQIDRLVDQMLETARLENGRFELRMQPVDLHEVTAVQIAKFQPLAPKHTLVLRAQAPPPVTVVGDLSRIETIVANLIDNAIKYSPRGGEVECEVGMSGSRAFVRIRDGGVGSRLPTRSNTKIRGTGLALYLSQEIAHRHGGEVVVESVPEGGSEFTLSLPASTAA